MIDNPAVDIPQDIQDKTETLLEERFRFADLDSRYMRILFNCAKEWVAAEMAADPESYSDKAPEAPKLADMNAAATPVDVLMREIKLPSLPQVIIELQQVINNPNSSAADLSDVISQDPNLSAYILRMVNSALYSFPSQIDTITRAVTVVGTSQLTSLALGTSVLSTFKDLSSQVLNMEHFWKHSITCGAVARLVAQKTKRSDAERYFVAGLLHDIGRLVVCSNLPDTALRIQAVAAEKHIPMYDAEQEVMGFTHAKLGAMLMRKWNFPVTLATGILYHHEPSKSEKHDEPAVVHVADIITKAIGVGASGNFYVPTIDETACERIGFTPENMDEILTTLDEQLEDTFKVLLPS